MISAHDALERIRAGNRRFVADIRRADAPANPSRRRELASGQEPFAIVLGCSDSRVPAEIVFDQGLGDLFVIRVAGNIVAPSQVGSVEFAADRFELAELNMRRARELRTNELIALSEYDKTLVELHQAEAFVRIHEASLKKARVDFERTTIYAPIDGIVISRNIEVGQTVASSFNTPKLFQIANDLSRMEIEAMVSQGYKKSFATAASAASSTIGPIIPPSIPMVIYAVIAEASVGKLFLGGIIPGLLMGLSMMVITYFMAKKRGFYKDRRATFREFIDAFRGAFLTRRRRGQRRAREDDS